jgi:hypothetical protein
MDLRRFEKPVAARMAATAVLVEACFNFTSQQFHVQLDAPLLSFPAARRLRIRAESVPGPLPVATGICAQAANHLGNAVLFLAFSTGGGRYHGFACVTEVPSPLA